MLLLIDVCKQNVGQMKLHEFCDEHGKCRERLKKTDHAFSAEDIVVLVTFCFTHCSLCVLLYEVLMPVAVAV